MADGEVKEMLREFRQSHKESMDKMSNGMEKYGNGMEKLGNGVEKLTEFQVEHSTKVEEQHKSMFQILRDNNIIIKYVFKFVVLPLLIIVGGLVGIKLL